MTVALAPGMPLLPDRFQRLPLDPRGYPRSRQSSCGKNLTAPTTSVSSSRAGRASA